MITRTKEYPGGVVVTVSYNEYDPWMSFNGGSYFQPDYMCVSPTGDRLSISDSSCGDFGGRFDATIYNKNGDVLARASWGSMLSEWEKGTTANYDDDVVRFWRDFAATHLGYHIPVIGEEL